jgi:high-affinity Fe2+/Pb2+ permease
VACEGFGEEGGRLLDAEGWGMLGFKKEGFYSIFFKLNRFGSVFSVSSLSNRNRTEPVSFFKILIGLIGFFYSSVFSVNFFSGFLSLIGFSVFFSPLISNLLYQTIEH